MNVRGVLLAAGSSERFGTPKLLAEWHGEALIRHALRAALASELAGVSVVVGPDEALVEAITDFPTGRLSVVTNLRVEDGMIASLQCGLRSLAPTCEGALVLLADMPWLPSSVIDRMLDGWEGGILIPVCAGSERHPRLLPRSIFSRFLALAPGQRPREALRGASIQRMEFEDADWFRDVDRPGDLLP